MKRLATQFVSYDLALTLKSHHYDRICNSKYSIKTKYLTTTLYGMNYNNSNDYISAPSFDEVKYWLYHTFDIYIGTKFFNDGNNRYFSYDIYDCQFPSGNEGSIVGYSEINEKYDSEYEALEAAIVKFFDEFEIIDEVVDTTNVFAEVFNPNTQKDNYSQNTKLNSNKETIFDLPIKINTNIELC